MSGVFAVADPSGRHPVAATLAQMGARLVHRPWHRCDHVADTQAPVGVGRLAGAGFNRMAQPVTSADGALTAVFSGLVWPADADRATGAGDADGDGAAARLFDAYRRHGTGFAADLSGEFVIALWDRAAALLLVASDRYGSYPTYYAVADGALLVAPEMRALFTWPSLRRQLDLSAMAQYMRFQCVLGTRTFFEGVHRVPPGTVLGFDLRTGALSQTRYWDLSHVRSAERIDAAEAVEETQRLLDRALRRQLQVAGRAGLYLSGGLDSRLLLGVAAAQGVSLTTLTYGQRRARDVVYAARLAARGGTRHHWFPLDHGDWVREHADLHIDLTEGFQSWVHAHGISTLAAAREHVDTAFTGFGGDVVVGALLHRLTPAGAFDDASVLASELFEFFADRHTWPGLRESEERVLYRPDLWRQVRGLAFDALLEEVRAAMHCPPALRPAHLELRDHTFGFINYRTVFGRSHIEMPSPFFDYAVADFVYGLPPRIRAYRTFERAILQRAAPAFSTIPYCGEGFLPTTRPLLHAAHAWALRLRRKVNAHVMAVWPEPLDLYADYEHYLRTDLRAWGEDLLLGPRTRARGLFEPAMLAALWARMQSGREPDIIGKLAPIMTYEHMLRRFVDA